MAKKTLEDYGYDLVDTFLDCIETDSGGGYDGTADELDDLREELFDRFIDILTEMMNDQ